MHEPDKVKSQEQLIGEGPQFAPGALVGEKYRIVSLLGHGGMGSVFKVEQIYLKQFFALKTIREEGMSEQAWLRFQKEARAISKLNHENLVRAHDFGLVDETHPYLVMDLIEGETLAARLKRSGVLSVPEAVSIFVAVCFGLDYARAQGIVHRDLKPSNIILTVDQDGNPGPPKVVDFGIAKMLGENYRTAEALTKTGDIFGTPFYMSPEQCTGVAVDHRSDIYSLGCVLFEALTAAPPFHGENALSTLSQQISSEVPSLKEASLGREFPEKLEQIVKKMLEKKPEDRYQTSAQVARELMSLTGAQPAETLSGISSAVEALAPVSAKGEKLRQAAVVLALAIALTLAFEIIKAAVSKPPVQAPVEVAPLGPLESNHEAEQLFYTHKEKGQVVFDFPKGIYSTIFFAGTGKAWTGKKAAVGHIVTPKDMFASLSVDGAQLLRDPAFFMHFREGDVGAVTIEVPEIDLGFTPREQTERFDAALSCLHSFKRMSLLRIEDIPISDRGLRSISDLSLERLLIMHAPVSGKAVSQMDCIDQLKTLHLEGIQDMAPILTRLAAHNTKLDTLRIRDVKLSPQDIALLARIAPRLKFLDVARCEDFSDSDLKQLIGMNKLEVLIVGHTEVGAASLPFLNTLPKLRELQVTGPAWTPEEVDKHGGAKESIKVSREADEKIDP